MNKDNIHPIQYTSIKETKTLHIPCSTLLHFDEGACTMIIDDVSIGFHKNQVVMIQSNTTVVIAPEPVVHLGCIHVKQCDQGMSCVPVMYQEGLSYLLQYASCMARKKGSCQEAPLHLISLIETELCQQGLYQHRDEALCSQIDAYLKDHMSNKLCMDDVANALHKSKSVLFHRYQMVRHTSPMETLMRMRLEQACLLLQKEQASVEAIALCCGFPSASYFIQRFKKHYHRTPLQYRKACIRAQQKTEKP